MTEKHKARRQPGTRGTLKACRQTHYTPTSPLVNSRIGEHPPMPSNTIPYKKLSRLLDLALVLYEHSKELLYALQASIPQDDADETTRHRA